MSEANDLKNSLKNEIEQYDDYLKKVKEHTEMVPFILRRKQEVEVKITFVNNVPEDILYKFAPTILPIQLNDERQVMEHIPYLPGLPRETRDYFVNPSGTSTAYQAVAYEAARYQYQEGQELDWYSPVAVAFANLAEMKSRNEYLPGKLNQINGNLGKMFIVAQNSVDKARSSLIEVDQAIMHMRDVIQQLWGELADLSKRRHPENFRGIQHLQVKKETQREIVAQCLASDENEYRKLILNLQSMAQIYSELSDTRIGKNPLGKDLRKMNELYDRWIVLIDDLTSLVAG